MTSVCLFFLAQQHSRPEADMAERKGWDQSQLRKYDIQLDEIPRLSVKDPRVDEFIAENVSTLRKDAIDIMTLCYAVVITSC